MTPPDDSSATTSGTSRPGPVRHWTPSDPLDRGRFLAGTVLAERYRVIGLLGKGGMGEVLDAGEVTPTNPPPIISGMVNAVLDPQGHLLAFGAVPPQVDASPGTVPDWTAPLAACDAQAAWTGVWPDQPNLPLRIEAGAWHGRPAYFQMIGPWTRAERTAADQPLNVRALGALTLILVLTVTVGGALLARHNVVARRGDRRGAFRLAFFYFCIQMLYWLFAASHLPNAREASLYGLALGKALNGGAVIGLLYLSFEPYVRRLWPQALITWSRLLDGRFRDAMVGRDVLIGVLFAICSRLFLSFAGWLGSAPGGSRQLDVVLDMRHTLAFVLGSVGQSILLSLSVFFVAFLVRALLRSQWLAAGAYIFILVAFATLSGSGSVAYPILLED